MAIIDTGNSSLSSATYESALAEALFLYRSNLKSDAAGSVGLTFTGNASSLRILAVLPLTSEVDGNGVLTTSLLDETDDGFSFTPDPVSDVQAATLPGAIMAIAHTIQGRDLLAGVIGDPVSMSIDTDDETVTIDVNCSLSSASGAAIAFSIEDYLQEAAPVS